MENAHEYSRPSLVLKKLLKLAVLGSALFYGYSKFDFDRMANNFSPDVTNNLHDIKMTIQEDTNLGRGTLIGPGAKASTLQGISTNTGAYEKEGFGAVTTINASALEKGRTYYALNSVYIKNDGDINNVTLVASQRLFIEGNCNSCNMSVMHVPFYGHTENVWGYNAALKTFGYQPRTVIDDVVYDNQPALVIKGTATDSNLYADDTGMIFVGINKGSKFHTDGNYMISQAQKTDIPVGIANSSYQLDGDGTKTFKHGQSVMTISNGQVVVYNWGLPDRIPITVISPTP